MAIHTCRHRCKHKALKSALDRFGGGKNSLALWHESYACSCYTWYIYSHLCHWLSWNTWKTEHIFMRGTGVTGDKKFCTWNIGAWEFCFPLLYITSPVSGPMRTTDFSPAETKRSLALDRVFALDPKSGLWLVAISIWIRDCLLYMMLQCFCSP